MGLLTAILLKLKGVTQIEIIDPREGSYIRPGHINEDIFSEVQELIRAHLPSSEIYDFVMSPSAGLHIKEIERMLYQKAVALGIKITKDKFLRIAPKKGDDTEKGIIVLSANTQEEVLLPAQHVFDCTGGRREVCKSYNQQVETPQFVEEKVFGNVIIKNHLIYNTSLKLTDAYILDRRWYGSMYSHWGTLEQMEALRGLGWTRAVFPTVYKHKGTTKADRTKYCFYLEAPDGLDPEQYDEWFKICMDFCLSGYHLEFMDLKSSVKYGESKHKVRKQTYLVDPTFLNKYEGVNPTATLPGVYPIGDAQVTPDSRLAHGISDGQRRIRGLMTYVNINTKGELVNIDLQHYRNHIESNIHSHNKDIRSLQRMSRISKEFIDVDRLINRYQDYLISESTKLTSADRVHLNKTISIFESINAYYLLFHDRRYGVYDYTFQYPLTAGKAKEIIKRILKDSSLESTLACYEKLSDIITHLPLSFVEEREAIGTIIYELYQQADMQLPAVETTIAPDEKKTAVAIDEPKYTPGFFPAAEEDDYSSTVRQKREELLEDNITKYSRLFRLLIISPTKDKHTAELISLSRYIIQLHTMKGELEAAKAQGEFLSTLIESKGISHPSLLLLKKDLSELSKSLAHKDSAPSL